MITETFKCETTGFSSHVCMIRMNNQIYFTVDIFDTVDKAFLPAVKVFKPSERQKAVEYAKSCIGLAS